ncbi:MAG: redox-sensing transcriptional repressor Rex [Clostridia bacterium]|nr:redox-sensing transcriptional repressor Rex [Clostridia bacterium]
MPTRQVSAAVIRRLPRYYRYLGQLLREGVLRISSSELANMMCITASQIRQDLNCFGGFGQQGYGYHVQHLYDTIGELLGARENYTAIFVGLGNLGHSLVEGAMLERRGIQKLAIFETNPALIGTTVAGLPVLDAADMEEWCTAHEVTIGILAIPSAATEEVAQKLARAGIKGIWNFSDTELDLHIDGVEIENMHLSDALLQLCYRLRQASHSEEDAPK